MKTRNEDDEKGRERQKEELRRRKHKGVHGDTI
jgi:hypothetical protein